MKKGFSGIVLSLLLVLTMGTTVYAADTFPSPGNTTGLDKVAADWDSKIDSNITALNENNVSVSVKKDKPTAAQVTEANEEVKKIGNAEILGMSDLSVENSSVITSKGLTVTLSVPGVKPTDKVYVLHKINGGWERLKATAGNGTVTCTMYSFSPVAVIRYSGTGELSVSDPSKNTDTGNNGGTGTSNNTENNSHNTTGDTQNNNQSNSQTNSNNQSNPQTNNQSNSQTNNQSNSQNNPVSVNQNVTVNYPEAGAKQSQMSAGQPAGAALASAGASYAVAPKTGSSMPALPIVTVLALACGIAACGKKAKRL